jgi:hypothetical protein
MTRAPASLASVEQPRLALVAYCLDCRVRHPITTTPLEWLYHMESWRQKHPGHRLEFRSPSRRLPRRFPAWLERLWAAWGRQPWWLDWRENADIKTTYEASAAYTISLASLATSSTWVAGRESTAVSNTTALDLDYLVGGRITVGTTPTTNTVIEVWAYGSVNDTPTYPDVVTGSDANITFTSVGIKHSSFTPLGFLAVDSATTNRVYWLRPSSLAAAFGGVVPKNHGLLVTHNTGVNLNSTGGNHVFSSTGCFLTAA